MNITPKTPIYFQNSINLKNPIFMKYFRYLIVFVISALVIAELFFRWYGLHDYPTYREDPNYEYIHTSNQQRVIYRNEFFTNSFGMRSDNIDNKKRKILLIGDSVINGGNRNSNKELASSIIQEKLGDSFQVLNISSGSWGPDNGMEFLIKHGNFDADLICLIFNSHDAGDIIDFTPVVGIDPIRPNKNDFFAFISFCKRFLIPKMTSFKKKEAYQFINKETHFLNPGWDFFNDYCRKHKIPLLVYLHAEKNEVKKGMYNQEGDKIISFCNRNNIKLVQDINQLKSNYFSDGIHLNKYGQKMIADILTPEIIQSLEDKSN